MVPTADNFVGFITSGESAAGEAEQERSVSVTGRAAT
jgi:hypothetical protein